MLSTQSVCKWTHTFPSHTSPPARTQDVGGTRERHVSGLLVVKLEVHARTPHPGTLAGIAGVPMRTEGTEAWTGTIATTELTTIKTTNTLQTFKNRTGLSLFGSTVAEVTTAEGMIPPGTV